MNAFFFKDRGLVTIEPNIKKQSQSDESISRKRALVSYLVNPLLNPPKKIRFSNDGIAINLIKSLNELGYIVDVVNWDDQKFIPKKKYDIFIGHGGKNFENIYSHLNKDAVTIYFSTGSYWKFHNEQEIRRFNELKNRKSVTLPYDRYIHESEEFANSVADGIICLGNHHSRETYSNFPLVLNLNNASYFDNHYDLNTKNLTENRNNYLFFSGSGNVHKGLDLLLEAFSHSDKNLYICTSIDDNFKRVYKKELEQSPNIHYIGLVQLQSKQFYKIINTCNYIILPSCSEGSPGSVIDCLQYGLIPIVSKESNIDVQNYGFILDKCSIEEIIKTINEVSDKSIEWLNEKTLLSSQAAITYYSEDVFLNNLKEHIRYIVEKTNAQ